MVEKLETMTPDPAWEPDDQGVLDTLGAEEYVFHVWGDDGCGDCQRELPRFAAALEAAGVPDERVVQYPVERTPQGKVGPNVEAYGIERIPTVVVERAGRELVRFVEEESVPAAVYLAERLRALEHEQ